MKVKAECRLQHQDANLEVEFCTRIFFSELILVVDLHSGSNEQVEK